MIDLRSLAQLRSLQLFGNPLDFLPELTPCSSLRHLSLANVGLLLSLSQPASLLHLKCCVCPAAWLYLLSLAMETCIFLDTPNADFILLGQLVCNEVLRHGPWLAREHPSVPDGRSSLLTLPCFAAFLRSEVRSERS